MPEKFTSAQISLLVLEIALGLIVLWKVQFSASARERLRGPRPLPRWEAPPLAFAVAILAVMVGVLLASGLVSFGVRQFAPGFSLQTDFGLVVGGAAFHAGILIGVIIGAYLLRMASGPQLPPASPAETPLHGPVRLVLAGVGTLLVTLAILYPAAALWEKLLETMDVEVEKQVLLDLFNQPQPLGKMLFMVFVAVVLAPASEELVFRAGFFGYLRTRVPHWLALLIPALLFAALHQNLQAFPLLALLGVIFSLAYERTGRIVVPIIAHGLFNLHTIVAQSYFQP
jgi:uncharacterized protein